jgi:hypothetical protein
MSISTRACYDFAAHNPRRSSRKAISQNFFGGAAVACLIAGCAWTVYANVFGAGIYPAMSGGSFDVADVGRPPPVARKSFEVANSTILVEHPPAVAAPKSFPSGPSLSFDDRFAAAAPQSIAPRPAEAPRLAEAAAQAVQAPQRAEASKPREALSLPVKVAAIAAPPAPRAPETPPAKTPGDSIRDMAQRAKAAVMSIASADKPSIVEKLWGKPQPRGSLLSFASADVSATSSLGPSQNPALGGTQPLYDRSTAVYDISAHMVYLPDGTRLEAHSGLGSKLDDPRYVHVRMLGATPPHLYDLQPREALFHGVPALRLNPVGGEEAIYGRSGLLAHTYMLGPNGDSNGCVSFKDYNAFLNAYRNQGIKRLAVVARVE